MVVSLENMEYVSFQSPAHSNYLGMNPGNDAKVYGATHCKAWEQFLVIHHGDGVFSFQSKLHGNYIGMDPGNDAKVYGATNCKAWERFTVTDYGDDVVAVKSVAHGNYLGMNEGNDAKVYGATHSRAWERLKVIGTAAGTVTVTRREVDVRSENWYSHYRHSVFAIVNSAMSMGCRQIKLVQVKPPAQFPRTNEEVPALMLDIYDAYQQKKSPFFDRAGNERIPAEAITVSQDSKESLAAMLEVYSQGDMCAIVASCAGPHFDETETIIKQHNSTRRSKNLQAVLTGWATADDMYKNPTRD